MNMTVYQVKESNVLKDKLMNYSGKVIALKGTDYEGLNGYFETILACDERETENECLLDIVVNFEQPSLTEYPILRYINAIRQLCKLDGMVMTDDEVIHRVEYIMDDIKPILNQNNHELFLEVESYIKKWIDKPSNFEGTGEIIEKIEQWINRDDVEFTHPHLNGTSIKMVLMGEEELAFYKHENDIFPVTFKEQPVCPSCYEPINKVTQTQYDYISWEWNEVKKEYVKRCEGDSDSKTCQCGFQFDDEEEYFYY